VVFVDAVDQGIDLDQPPSLICFVLLLKF